MPNHNGTKINPVRLRHHKKWDEFVRNISGGLTVLNPVKGQWVYSNNLHNERMIPVRIVCDQDQMNSIADFTCKHYRQIEVLYYCMSAEVHFHRPKTKKT